ncbi:MAG: rhodanese-like domain-containing protein [Phaeodactylibacter sp.]|nr:rhodanese-like domain-containing protein [Phaeodactylibacter sp.]MCB9272882.1 rhodanese-like domain-containing protein [Lewinellaceae bacterium]
MKKIYGILIALAFGKLGCTQAPGERPHVLNPAFDKKIGQMLSFTVPAIGVGELNDIQNEVFIFDARELQEYELSHIKGARYLGYDDFDESRLIGVSKDSKIVLYCSIGYRSEKIGEKLQKMGYTNIYNLYGSIFEWVNEGYPIVGPDGKPTRKLHTYDSKWSQWVDPEKAEKVW